MAVSRQLNSKPAWIRGFPSSMKARLPRDPLGIRLAEGKKIKARERSHAEARPPRNPVKKLQLAERRVTRALRGQLDRRRRSLLGASAALHFWAGRAIPR
ncbi:hypothetical protein BJX70DRAFT_317256 [Aspergillus crustosus]